MIEEDRKKVLDKLNDLNQGENPDQWLPAMGFHYYPRFVFGIDGRSNQMEVDSGIAVKLFVNTTTGEIRTFSADFYVKAKDA